MTSSSGHARLSPSGAYVWSVCTASVGAIATLPPTLEDEPENPDAIEGQRAHELLAQCLVAREHPTTKVDHDLVGPNKEEMGTNTTKRCKGAGMAYDYAIAYLADRPNAVLRVEHHVNPALYTGSEENHGTADIILHDPDTEHLCVVDYKNGFGLVEVEGNHQTALYGVGAIAESEFCMAEDVTLVIIQPNGRHEMGPVREWNLSAADLLDWVAENIVPALHAIATGTVRFAPSGKRCRWCDYGKRCRARIDWALNKAGSHFEPITETHEMTRTADDYTDEELFDLLPHVDAIIQTMQAIWARADRLAKLGQAVPGHKLVRGRTNRAWTDNEERTVDYLVHGLKMAIRDVAPPKLRSPTQMEEMIRKTPRYANWQKTRKEQFAACVHKPEGALTLVPNTDPGDAVAVGGWESYVEDEDDLLS